MSKSSNKWKVKFFYANGEVSITNVVRKGRRLRREEVEEWADVIARDSGAERSIVSSVGA